MSYNRNSGITIVVLLVFCFVFACFSMPSAEQYKVHVSKNDKASNLNSDYLQHSDNAEAHNTKRYNTRGSNDFILVYNNNKIPFKLYNRAISKKLCSVKVLMPGICLVSMNVSGSVQMQFLDIILQDSSVISVKPDSKRYLNEIPNDEYFENQWALQNIEAVDAWSKVSSIKKFTVVCVIDTGVNSFHHELKNRLIDGKGFRDGSIVTDTSDMAGMELPLPVLFTPRPATMQGLPV